MKLPCSSSYNDAPRKGPRSTSRFDSPPPPDQSSCCSPQLSSQMFIGETLTEMPSPTAYGLFMLAALTLLILPGPAVLYIVSRSVDQGRAAGLASVLGVTTGTLIQIGAATIGLSSLVLASAIAFDVVKYAGAVYLIVLGIMRLRSRRTAIVHGEREPRTLRRLYTQGVIVNTLNPKTALFIFALLPQFVDVQAGHVWLQVL